jgi:hypothetical protein|tara:strand:- start:597 stop:1220 length:624 start_codon:yes stop_codon:yes gene_type:complete
MLFLFLILFLAGLYFYAKQADPSHLEAMTNQTNVSKQRCPNLLIQKGAKFYLYNSKLAKVPGVNPIEFDNLEEYVEFLSWQKSQAIKCPVLYLQETFNAQGNPCYKVRPGVTEQQGGLPPCPGKRPNPNYLLDASRNDPPYNINAYPGFDPANQYIGSTTPLDVMNDNKTAAMGNSMSSSWKGVNFTKARVKSGYYKANEVGMKDTT